MAERVVFRADEGPVHQLRPDFAGLVVEGDKGTLVRWDVPAGREPTAPLHSHEDHEQFCVVLSGRVEMVIGKETVTLGEGDICRIRRNVLHGRLKALDGKPAVVHDFFAPARAEYAAMAKGEPVR